MKLRKVTGAELASTLASLQLCKNNADGCGGTGSVEGFACHRCGDETPKRRELTREEWNRFMSWLPKRVTLG